MQREIQWYLLLCWDFWALLTSSVPLLAFHSHLISTRSLEDDGLCLVAVWSWWLAPLFKGLPKIVCLLSIQWVHVANILSWDVSLRPYGAWIRNCVLYYLWFVLDWRARPSKRSRYSYFSVQLLVLHWVDHCSCHWAQDHRDSQRLELACPILAADVPITFANYIYFVSYSSSCAVSTNVELQPSTWKSQMACKQRPMRWSACHLGQISCRRRWGLGVGQSWDGPDPVDNQDRDGQLEAILD